MAFGTRVVFDTIRELAFGDFAAVYVALGPPTSDHVRLITINNSTNEEIYVTFNGVDHNLRVAPNGFKLLDLSANKVRDDGLFLAAGIQISVRYVTTLGTSGSVWSEVMYAEGGK